MSKTFQTIAEQKAEWAKVLREKGHDPVVDPDTGELDMFVTDAGSHNGPGCSRCGWSCCWHCKPDPNEAPVCPSAAGPDQ